MNEEQTVVLCRTVKAYCPAQTIDRYTPAAWFDLLGEYSFQEAMEAVRAMARIKAFISPADIIGEIGRVRGAELDNARNRELFASIHVREQEVREGRRGKPPASLRETLAELRASLAP